MKTYTATPSDVTRSWYIIDASSAPLGKIASKVAQLLIGKGKPQFTKHIDCGDYVIIVNAAQLKVSGNKPEAKKYYHHSQHPGGLRERTLNEQMIADPTQVIRHAVRGMLPVNKLRDERLNRLKIYAGTEHSHEAQKPTEIK